MQPGRARISIAGLGWVPVQALGSSNVEIGIRCQCADKRQAYLSAMGVSGNDRVVPVMRELVQHSQVRRVRNRQAHVHFSVGWTGHERQVVVSQVRVVDTSESDPNSVDFQVCAPIGQLHPAC